jgi:hypothetical protein
MSIQIFNITWVNISDNLLPWYWRDLSAYDPDNTNPFWMRNWMRCIMEAIEDLTNQLFENAFNNQKKYYRTGQHGVLEIVLNSDFDSVSRRIYLSNAFGLSNYNYSLYLQGETNPNPLDFYKQGEVDPSPKTFFTGAESAGEFDFIVNIPSALSIDIPRFRGVVDSYRTLGKRYDIIFF